MITLAEINPEALYVPGLRFWRPTWTVRYSLVAQNINGAVEIWHAAKDPAVGGVVAHLPESREGYEPVQHCAVLLGSCFCRESDVAYRGDFYPLLANGTDEAVLKQLADWHDQVHAGTRVTAS